jgi:predicted dehydrogenase
MAETSPSIINIGVVGLGFMAATHLRAYRQVPGTRIKALCNPSGRNLDGDFTNVAGNVGSNEPFKVDMTDVCATRVFEELLNDSSIDVIDICAPTAGHRDLAIAALQSGKHVICEKPLARTSKAAREIAQAAGKARGIFMPAMCVRFWPEWAWLKRTIEQKTYGNVLSARFRRVAEPPGWGLKNFFNGAESGGALFDLHIHDTDFVQYCFGKPKSVYSTGYTKFSGAIDHVVTQYHFDSAAIIHAEGSWAMAPGFGFSMCYTVNFENATADYDLARGKESLRVSANKEQKIITCDEPDGYVQELQHLVDSIRAGKKPSIVTTEDAVTSIEICEAEEKSVNTRTVIKL